MNLDNLLEGPEKEERKQIIYGGLILLGFHLLVGTGILFSQYSGKKQSDREKGYLIYTNQAENRR